MQFSLSGPSGDNSPTPISCQVTEKLDVSHHHDMHNPLPVSAHKLSSLPPFTSLKETMPSAAGTRSEIGDPAWGEG